MFMNRLQMLFFEDGNNLLIQSNAGKSTKRKKALIQEALNEKSRHAEDAYAANKMSASELLRQAANHFDDDKVIDVFRASADMDITESKPSRDPDEAAIEDDINFDERMWVLSQDPDLTDIGINSWAWTTSKWLDQPSLPPEKLYSLRRDDPNEVTTVLCVICHSKAKKQYLVNCGHFFCYDCVNRTDFKNCFLCRTPILNRRAMNFSCLTLVWKDEDHLYDTDNANQNRSNRFNTTNDEEGIPDNEDSNINLHAQHLASHLNTANEEEEQLLIGEGKSKHIIDNLT
jgi:hypothetical protein